jgi:hypothetical protein
LTAVSTAAARSTKRLAYAKGLKTAADQALRAHARRGEQRRRILDIQRCEAAMSEIVFLVEEAPEGGLTARALGESIFTQAESYEDLREAVRDAVRCHFDDGTGPAVIRLHYVRDEVLAA